MIRIKWEELYIPTGENAGYLNFDYLINKLPYPFIWIIGARGVGKSYGAVQYAHDHDITPLWLRRTQTQADSISRPAFFTGKDYYNDYKIAYDIDTVAKNLYGVWTDCETDDEGNPIKEGLPDMYIGALSTIYNVRGVSRNLIDTFLYDEFIPEPHAKPIKNEGEALLNAYESFAGNRELQGKKPLKFIGMSNSNRLDNPLFAELGMIVEVDRTFSKGYPAHINEERGFVVINVKDSPISKRKENTALYRMAKGTDFADMALKNKFRGDRSRQNSYPIKSLVGVARIGDITLCKVKGSDAIYMTGTNIGVPREYPATEKGLEAFKKTQLYRGLWLAYLNNEVEFENYNIEYLYKHYCGKA